MKKHEPNKLFDRLERDPARFDELGSAYQLLQAMFDRFGRAERAGLERLLRSGDLHKHRVAVFVLSEIGEDVSDLVESVTPLLTSNDRGVRYTAAEIVTRYSDGSPQLFAGVCRLLDDSDEVIRVRAAELVSRASDEQLAGALESELRRDPSSHHARGLRWLVHPSDHSEVAVEICSESPLSRIYAAIYAKRHGGALLREMTERNRDDSLRDFLMAE